MQALDIAGHRFDVFVAELRGNTAHDHGVTIVRTVTFTEVSQLLGHVLSMLTAQVREAGCRVTCAIRRVATGARGHALIHFAATEQILTASHKLLIGGTDTAFLAGEIGSDIGQVLIAQVGQQARHFQNRALARLDVVQLFFQSRKLGVPGIPEDTELKIVERDIDMSRRTGVHVHFQHVSTAISFDAIRKAKAEGLPITCETAPHYIALNDEALLKYGTLAKMNPPLRSEADRQATIAAVADGTVDLLATDHAPHTMEEKELGFLDAPNGIIGLECAYGVCHKILVDGGFISDERLIELMSTGPAELMGHDKTDITAVLDDYADAVPGDDDTKRVLDLGRVPESDQVDLVVLNTGEEWTVDPEKFHSSARNTPFGGWQVTGRPLATIIGSKLAFSRIDKED